MNIFEKFAYSKATHVSNGAAARTSTIASTKNISINHAALTTTTTATRKIRKRNLENSASINDNHGEKTEQEHSKRRKITKSATNPFNRNGASSSANSTIVIFSDSDEEEISAIVDNDSAEDANTSNAAVLIDSTSCDSPIIIKSSTITTKSTAASTITKSSIRKQEPKLFHHALHCSSFPPLLPVPYSSFLKLFPLKSKSTFLSPSSSSSSSSSDSPSQEAPDSDSPLIPETDVRQSLSTIHTLVLGSAPSAASLQKGQYYAHPQNHFWPIMGKLRGFDSKLPYTERVKALVSSGVAIWDVCAAFSRKGSSDNELQMEEMNRIFELIKGLPNLSLIGCNGGQSWTIWKRYLKQKNGEVDRYLVSKSIRTVQLPSTSPAYAVKNPVETKATAWKELLNW